jgi:hypothetical protein
MATFTLKVQVVPCVTEHTVTTCKMRPGLGLVLDLTDIRATRHALLPVIQTALRVLIAFSSRSFAGSSALLPWRDARLEEKNGDLRPPFAWRTNRAPPDGSETGYGRPPSCRGSGPRAWPDTALRPRAPRPRPRSA